MNISTDKIAEQWSHRVGIIDKNDPLHIIELKKILNRHKLEESVIDQYVSNLLGEKERIYERDFHEKNILLELKYSISASHSSEDNASSYFSI